jgi:hypothetical protein
MGILVVVVVVRASTFFLYLTSTNVSTSPLSFLRRCKKLAPAENSLRASSAAAP